MSNEAALQLLGCVVKGKLGSAHDEYSACGIMLYPRQGIVLSHGSILSDFCLKNKTLNSKITYGELITPENLPECEFTVLVDRRWTTSSSAVSRAQIIGELVNDNSSSVKSAMYSSLNCRFVCAFRNDDFHEAICSIMPKNNWTFASDNDDSFEQKTIAEKTNEETTLGVSLLSYFLLFKIDSNPVSQNNTIFPGSLFPAESLQNSEWCCSTGDVAEIVSTPFGSQNPSVFFNTYSQGVVCNVSGPNGCWILTDARCIPGSEGAPLITRRENGERHLAGIITASLCWKNKEWVGFALASNLQSVQKALVNQMKKNQLALKVGPEMLRQRRVKDKKSQGKPFKLLSRTVLVSVGGTWGSGIIVNKEQGLFLTCSHVVKGSHHFPVMIKLNPGSPQFKATVLYSHESALNKPFDVAVLKCMPVTHLISTHSVPSLASPAIGERVWVVGHAVFSTHLNLQPSVSAGVVSKIICHKGQPVMVQTTCAVHPGASGGPLLNSAGDLVGLVVCNTVDKGSNSSYPHVNMSVPAMSVWPQVQHYIQTGDSSVFSQYEIQDSYIRKLWALDNISHTRAEAETSIKSKL